MCIMFMLNKMHSKIQPKHKTKKSPKKHLKSVLIFCVCVALGSMILALMLAWAYEHEYRRLVYPGITIDAIDFSGQNHQQIVDYWQNRNLPLTASRFTFIYEDKIATISAMKLDLGYDATLSATQALSIGRTGNFFTDLYQKCLAFHQGINLSPMLRWKNEEILNVLNSLAQDIDRPAQNALFEFKNNRVTAFKISAPGQKLDVESAQKDFRSQVEQLVKNKSTFGNLTFHLNVVPLAPQIRTEQVNDFGIQELLGMGESYFRGSIAGRIHNIALAASRINGTLIPPGETFSFNRTVGDISAATGYKQAYIIKSGRTVLDDGGGVCQVSTTLFRAALNSGLPIIERHAHSYRVGYYEQGKVKPGFDATVYDPRYDLKIKNDTQDYILIQSDADTANTKLTFELFGKKDNRQIDISSVRLWDPLPAPPDLYQDDPTLPAGTIKQVDWAAPGIKAAFDYQVTRDEEVLFKTTFFSNFIPWQAVYLRGTGPN